MALKIRMRQQGRANRQTYRLVVTDIRNPRDGKYLEMIGWYNPYSATKECVVNADRIQYWVGLGAEITPNAQALIARIAPDVIKELRAKEHARRIKKAAKRRMSKKSAAKKAAPAAENAGSAEKPAAKKAPAKPRAAAKKTAK